MVGGPLQQGIYILMSAVRVMETVFDTISSFHHPIACLHSQAHPILSISIAKSFPAIIMHRLNLISPIDYLSYTSHRPSISAEPKRWATDSDSESAMKPQD